MVLLVDTPAKPESPSKSESVPGSPNQELLRRLSYLSRGDDRGAEDGAEEDAVVEEYSSTEVKALPTPHYRLQKWFPDDPSSIPKETQQLWLDRASTPLIDPDCFARRRNFVVSDVHVLLVNSDNDERLRLKLSLEALGYVVSGAASFPVAQRLLREHAGDYHANPNPHPHPKPGPNPNPNPRPRPTPTPTPTPTPKPHPHPHPHQATTTPCSSTTSCAHRACPRTSRPCGRLRTRRASTCSRGRVASPRSRRSPSS